MAEPININERVAKIEWSQEQINDRLSQGAGTFGQLRDAICEVRDDMHKVHKELQKSTAPKPTPWYRVAGFILAISVVVVGWVWQASKYPDRDEFNSFRDKQETAIKDMREKQFTMSTEQRVLTETMKRQEEATKEIDSKLDRLLDKQ